MFSIGSRTWPGISKLMEECGEVVQVCGKLIATGGRTEHWDGGGDLKARLEEEIADVMAACRFVIARCGLDTARVDARADAKLKRFDLWHGNPFAAAYDSDLDRR